MGHIHSENTTIRNVYVKRREPPQGWGGSFWLILVPLEMKQLLLWSSPKHALKHRLKISQQLDIFVFSL